jgi:hypothetical protein
VCSQPEKDVTGHWYIDLDLKHEGFATHWKVKEDGTLIEKDQQYGISTQGGFDTPFI